MRQSVPEGYKKTDIGIFPVDWDVKSAGEIFIKIQDGTHFSPKMGGSDYLYITSRNIKRGKLDISTAEYIDELQHKSIYRRCDVRKGDVLLTKDGANTGNAALNTLDEEVSLLSSVAFLRVNGQTDSAKFFLQQIMSSEFQKTIQIAMSGNAITRLTLSGINKLLLFVPNKKEQIAIANALSDVDALISSLEKLIAKKRAMKTATMQQLLTGKKRLPPFDQSPTGTKQIELGEIPEDWEVVSIREFADCLDHLRVPLNESQRAKMAGDIPYCGANGIVGSVNDYVVDDDIILMAEDGGYFDEFAERPIAYRMIGKCWVNNHAHILKAKNSKSQTFLFYSLVHKDIQKHLASGTRAKLNKSELEKISFVTPSSIEEQELIGEVLGTQDSELESLVNRLQKTKEVKQGMMQELLTGRTRLI